MGFQGTHKNFLDKKLTPKNSPAEFPSIDCGCLSPFYQHLSFSHLVVYSPTLYVHVHADNKGKARVSRGTHNFLNISFKIQSTNKSHRFSENPHSIVKKNSLLFQKKKYIFACGSSWYRKGTSRIESFEEKVIMCFLKTFAFLLFAF